MNANVILRYVIMALSGGVAVVGILMLTGLVVFRNLPEQYQVIMGTIVLLYGVYRFSIAFFRKPGVRREDDGVL
jgi:prolipoprotein diacylglyceryltransferase